MYNIVKVNRVGVRDVYAGVLSVYTYGGGVSLPYFPLLRLLILKRSKNQ